MKPRARLLLGVWLAFAPATSLAQSAAARGVIDGVVTDTNLVALGSATVSILGSDLKVSTGDNGRFRITGLHSGNYILAVHRLGYVPVAVGMGLTAIDTLRPSFELRRVATALDTMIVTAKSAPQRLDEFEQRRAHGEGHFITAADIENAAAFSWLTSFARCLPWALTRSLEV